MASAESLKVLRTLQSRPENKVRILLVCHLTAHTSVRARTGPESGSVVCRPALIATQGTRNGLLCRTVSSCVWNAAENIEAWGSI